jgi:hypothetical protein
MKMQRFTRLPLAIVPSFQIHFCKFAFFSPMPPVFQRKKLQLVNAPRRPIIT